MQDQEDKDWEQDVQSKDYLEMEIEKVKRCTKSKNKEQGE